jgi:hypothetical protein
MNLINGDLMLSSSAHHHDEPQQEVFIACAADYCTVLLMLPAMDRQQLTLWGSVYSINIPTGK